MDPYSNEKRPPQQIGTRSLTICLGLFDIFLEKFQSLGWLEIKISQHEHTSVSQRGPLTPRGYTMSNTENPIEFRYVN
mgnify:FL=1